MNFIIQDIPLAGKTPKELRYSSSYQSQVFVNEKKNTYMTIKNGETISKSELLFGRYNRVFTIDMQVKTHEFSREVTSRSRGRHFSVNLFIDLAVEEPTLLVQQGAGEIGTIFYNNLPLWVEKNALNYDIHEEREFETYIENYFSTSPLVGELRKMGIGIKDLRLLIKQSARDEQRDIDFVDIFHESQKSNYAKSLEKENDVTNSIQDVDYAKTLLREGKTEIVEVLASHNTAVKILLEEWKQEQRKLKQADIRKAEQLKLLEEQKQKWLLDDTIDSVEYKRKVEQLMAKLSLEDEKPAVASKSSGFDTLEDFYQNSIRNEE